MALQTSTPFNKVAAGYTQFKVGAYTITVVPLGQMSLDGGAMFGVVPKVLWNKLIEADDLNRIPLALNTLLIEYQPDEATEPIYCFVDAGMGTKWSDKHKQMYAIQGNQCIAKALEPLGVKTSQIHKHLLTHLHFDHAGGATRFDENGVTVPTFENAHYYVHQGDWQDAHDPTPKSKASYLKENFDPLEATGRLVLLDGDENEILPGLSFRVTGGHIDYHQVLVLDVPEGGFIFWGDLVPTHHHLRIPYVAAYDLYPVDLMKIKKTLIEESYQKQWVNVFEHDLERPVGLLEYVAEKDTYLLKA